MVNSDHILPANERVTDGARTRDLRSHNPMLYRLSYGHHAQGDSTSERARSKCDARRLYACSVSPAEELGLLVVPLSFVDYAEEPGGARGLDDHHVSLYVVDLDGDAEVVSWCVFVGHFACNLHGGLLLAIAVATQLEGLVRVEPLGPSSPAYRRRRKTALTWATPSSSRSTVGTRITSSME